MFMSKINVRLQDLNQNFQYKCHIYEAPPQVSLPWTRYYRSVSSYEINDAPENKEQWHSKLASYTLTLQASYMNQAKRGSISKPTWNEIVMQIHE